MIQANPSGGCMLRQTEPRKGREKERKEKERRKRRGCGVGAKLPHPSCGSDPIGWCCMSEKTCVQGRRGWGHLRQGAQRARAQDRASPTLMLSDRYQLAAFCCTFLTGFAKEKKKPKTQQPTTHLQQKDNSFSSSGETDGTAAILKLPDKF